MSHWAAALPLPGQRLARVRRSRGLIATRPRGIARKGRRRPPAHTVAHAPLALPRRWPPDGATLVPRLERALVPRLVCALPLALGMVPTRVAVHARRNSDDAAALCAEGTVRRVL